MELVFGGTIIPVLNRDIIKEYRDVLLRSKFHLTEDIVADVIDVIETNGLFVEANALDIVLPDPKDKVFYEVVMEERKDEDAYLVTGNIRHFPQKPFIVTPRQMLDIVLADTEGN